MSYNKEQPRVAIVGSGIAGIATAIALKRQLNFENFLIFEKASDIGGTWRDNTYPGCSSDVAGHWYSLSTDPNPNWSSYFVLQPEILAYWKSLVVRYHLHHRLVVNTRVVSAVWDDVAQNYCLTLRDENSGDEREELVEAIVSAAGGLTQPVYPNDIIGIDEFKGATFHSSRWRHDVSFSKKRVGVIGNAASGAQIIPRISSDPTVEVINLCRTPNWFVPRPNFGYPPWVKWAFSHIPCVLWTYRTFVAAKYELGYLTFRNSNKSLQSFVRKQMTKHIEEKAPRKYVAKLIPDYPPGCRRIIVDPGYLDALHRPNVTLTWDGIDKIVPEGIVTKKGDTILLDVIIFATGFDLGAVQVNPKGSEGRTLQEYFDAEGGPTAYLGTTVPGFPNFFMLMGPNTATGHTSIIFSEEVQINYTLQLLKPIIRREAKSFTVRAAASDAYNERIQRRIGGSVFTACTSFYRAGKNGKNIAIFPGPLVLFWWWALRPCWVDYEARGADAWERKRRRRKVMRALLTVVLLIGLTGAAQPRVVKAAVDKALSKTWGRLCSIVRQHCQPLIAI